MESSDASPGPGRWFDVDSDVIASDEAMIGLVRHADEALSIGFPRDWPACFKEGPLKAFIKTLQGKRCRVVLPPSADNSMIEAMRDARPMQSFFNAELFISRLQGWRLVKGWQVVELLDEPSGTSFIAVRHWWVSNTSDVWLDPSPTIVPSSLNRKLFVESPSGEKPSNHFDHLTLELTQRWERRLRQGSKKLVACQPTHSARHSARIYENEDSLCESSSRCSAAVAMGPVLLGKQVLISGLISRVELNGRQGVASSYNTSSERYNVRVGADTVALKPINLSLASMSIRRPAPSHTATDFDKFEQTVSTELESMNAVRLIRVEHEQQPPSVLLRQRQQDLEGGGVPTRAAAEAELTEHITTLSIRRTSAKTQLSAIIDRLLSNEARCHAYSVAIGEALRDGRRTMVGLGCGSLLPLIEASRAGCKVIVVEPCVPLASIVRAAAAANAVQLAVVSHLSMVREAWSEPPGLLLCETVDSGLLGEAILPVLHHAVSELKCTRSTTKMIPHRAVVHAVAVQLAFEGVPGFGLDGLDIDLRAFDELRPSGGRALFSPGFWPVRLLAARQPFRRLSDTFEACAIDFWTAADDEKEFDLEAISDGLLNAVVFWFTLHTGEREGASCSSAPSDAAGHGKPGTWTEGWKQAACYLQRPRYVCKGERIKLGFRQTERGIRFENATDVCISSSPKPAVVTRLGAQLPITSYHFCMLADTVRNEAYRSAIERAVSQRRGCRVLDLGSGSGLLALIAIRAGAESVHAVEMNPVLARTSQTTLARSRRLAEKDACVVVWNCISTHLAIDPMGQHGPSEMADLIVCEIFDTGLIGEGCLHTLRDASRRLLQPGGHIIPAAATVYVMLVQICAPEHGDTCLSALDALREGHSPVRLHTVNHIKLSNTFAVMRFDFDCLTDQHVNEVKLRVPACRSGCCNAVAWWFNLHLDNHTELNCGPGSGVRTWKQNLAYLPRPIPVTVNSEVGVCVINEDDNNIYVRIY